MMLSLSHMISRLGGLPHPHIRFSRLMDLAEHGGSDSPSFLHAGYTAFEPDLTLEVRRANGEEAVRLSGDEP